MVKQLVIAAGGIGSRMSSNINPLQSKALIEYKGNPLIFYLLNWASEAGIREYLVSVNSHNRKKIENVLDSLDLDYQTSLTGKSFSQVPSLFRSELDNKFLVMCGHDPIPSSHLIKLISESENADAVTTTYSNLENKNVNKRRIQLVSNSKYKLINLDKDNIPEDHIYSRNPYIINPDLVDEVIKDNFVRTAGYFIYKLWEKGGKVSSIPAISPVEFDYDHEFERTKSFLDNIIV